MTRRRDRPEVRANLTPMIDVTFLLIVFFVLVSQIVEVESEEMELPAPIEPVTERPGDEQRVVINVVPEPWGDGATGYRVGSRVFPVGATSATALSAHLASLFRGNPRLNVNLRADRRTSYQWIEPVLRAVRRAGADEERPLAARINLVIVRED